MANNIHFEARRKQSFLDRVSKARMDMAHPEDKASGNLASLGKVQKPELVTCTDQGQFYQTRNNLGLFRVNTDGHNNRYRNRQHLAPHCDVAYSLIYPETENPDYTDNPTRAMMRENSFVDSYEISKKVNGTLQMDVLVANPTAS